MRAAGGGFKSAEAQLAAVREAMAAAQRERGEAARRADEIEGEASRLREVVAELQRRDETAHTAKAAVDEELGAFRARGERGGGGGGSDAARARGGARAERRVVRAAGLVLAGGGGGGGGGGEARGRRGERRAGARAGRRGPLGPPRRGAVAQARGGRRPTPTKLKSPRSALRSTPMLARAARDGGAPSAEASAEAAALRAAAEMAKG